MDIDATILELDDRMRDLETRFASLDRQVEEDTGAPLPPEAYQEPVDVELSSHAMQREGEFQEELIPPLEPSPKKRRPTRTKPMPGDNVAEWVSVGLGIGGLVVDPGLARATKCIRVPIFDAHQAFSPGIIGPLDDEQEELYCGKGYEDRQPSDAQVAHIAGLAGAAFTCAEQTRDDPDRLVNYFSCIGRELRVIGIEP